MTTICTVTLTDQSRATKAAEVQLIAEALERAAVLIRGGGGAVTSGNILGEKALVLGTFSYSGSAPS